MSINAAEIYPIGTIVRLKHGTKKLMIFGILQDSRDAANPEAPAKRYDYVGVPYPEGSMGMQSQFCFNQENIEEVIARGYEDDERSEFIVRLNAFMLRTADQAGSQS